MSIDALDHRVQVLQEVVNSKRLTLSEKTAKEAQNPEDATDIQHDQLVSKELNINNREISQRLITATEQSNTLFQQNIQVKNWLDRGLQSEQNLKEQIQVLERQAGTVAHSLSAISSVMSCSKVTTLSTNRGTTAKRKSAAI